MNIDVSKNYYVMSKYNHIEFLKLDLLGEIGFVIDKVYRKIYENTCVLLCKLF